MTIGLIGFFVIFGLKMIFRKDLIAAIAAACLFTLFEGSVSNSSNWQVATGIYLVIYFSLVYVLLRFGLVATIVAVFFINSTNSVILGSDWKTWYAPAGLATLVLLLSIATFAFWRSLGSRDLIGDDGTEA